ncbi:MAG TPA: hypothetical protein VJ201_04770 [Candidatus Babeliales bacterium]|nr:hypothetical protein [Candidatus Babeliales bacterium]
MNIKISLIPAVKIKTKFRNTFTPQCCVSSQWVDHSIICSENKIIGFSSVRLVNRRFDSRKKFESLFSTSLKLDLIKKLI